MCSWWRPEFAVQQFIHVDNYGWTENAYKNIAPNVREFSYLDGLYGFSHNFNTKRTKDGKMKEHQSLVVLDECADLFNSRTYNKRDRLAWCKFFRQHRKLGYDVYLIAQDDHDIDKQIRELLMKEWECRSVASMKVFGKILGLLCGGTLFVRIKRDYSLRSGTRSKKQAKEYAQYFTGRKYFDFYDSYKLFG